MRWSVPLQEGVPSALGGTESGHVYMHEFDGLGRYAPGGAVEWILRPTDDQRMGIVGLVVAANGDAISAGVPWLSAFGVRLLRVAPTGHVRWVTDVRLTPEESTRVLGLDVDASGRTMLLVLDEAAGVHHVLIIAADGTPVRDVPLDFAAVSAAFTASGNLVVAGGDVVEYLAADGTLRWRKTIAGDGVRIDRIAAAPNGSLAIAGGSATGGFIAVTGGDLTPQWRAALEPGGPWGTNALMLGFSVDNEVVAHFNFSPSHVELVTFTRDGAALMRLEIGGDELFSLALSRNGDLLISGHATGKKLPVGWPVYPRDTWYFAVLAP